MRSLPAVMVLLLALALLAGCRQTSPSPQTSGSYSELATPEPPPAPMDPESYCPMEAGSQWTYQIALGDTTPVGYRLSIWPTTDGKTVSGITGCDFGPTIEKAGAKTFGLSLRIKGQAKAEDLPDRWQSRQAVEVEVLEDGLGIYREAQKVFWVSTIAFDQDEPLVHELLTYSPQAPFAPPEQYRDELVGGGYSQRDIFVSMESGQAIQTGERPEVLYYEGVEGDMLHLIRAFEDKAEHLEAAVEAAGGHNFTEDMWYRAGKGLVKLQQKVFFGKGDSKVSMTWELVSYQPGSTE